MGEQDERRVAKRLSAFFDVHFILPDATTRSQRVQAADLSETGCFVYAMTPPARTVGEVCRFMLFLGNEGTVTVDGEVVYANRHGIGVRFVNLTPVISEAIQRTVDAPLGDAQPLS